VNGGPFTIASTQIWPLWPLWVIPHGLSGGDRSYGSKFPVDWVMFCRFDLVDKMDQMYVQIQADERLKRWDAGIR
jgi:hypothetical protein